MFAQEPLLDSHLSQDGGGPYGEPEKTRESPERHRRSDPGKNDPCVDRMAHPGEGPSLHEPVVVLQAHGVAPEAPEHKAGNDGACDSHRRNGKSDPRQTTWNHSHA